MLAGHMGGQDFEARPRLEVRELLGIARCATVGCSADGLLDDIVVVRAIDKGDPVDLPPVLARVLVLEARRGGNVGPFVPGHRIEPAPEGMDFGSRPWVLAIALNERVRPDRASVLGTQAHEDRKNQADAEDFAHRPVDDVLRHSLILQAGSAAQVLEHIPVRLDLERGRGPLL